MISQNRVGLRIAVYHNLPSGGGKRALYEMMRHLAERHDLTVFTLSTAEHDFCDLRLYCREHFVYSFQPLPLVNRPFGRLNQGIRSVDLYRLEALQRKIAGDIDNSGFDLVFVHGCQFSTSPGILKYLQNPSVYYCQEPPRSLYEPSMERSEMRLSKLQKACNLVDPLPTLYRKSLNRLDQKNVRSAKAILANSHYSRETLYRTYGIFACVSRLGVDTNLFRPLSIAKKSQIISVGSLTARKGFDFIVRSLGRIEPRIRPRLVIVSNFTVPTEHDYLQDLAESEGVEVKFLTEISDSGLVEAYNCSLMTVYAPIMEPFGLVPLESMACGTPVIGVCEAGIRETVCHGENGLLVQRNVASFARAINELLGDQQQLATYGANARKYVEGNWTWGRAGNELESQLHRIRLNIDQIA